MRLKPGRCSVRFVPFSPRLIPVGQTWLAISKKLSSVMSCLNVWMNFLVWQLYNTLNTSVGITLLMVIYHFSPSLHPPRISASPPSPPLPAAGVQGEALREEVCVVPDRLVRRQLVQDQRPRHQLHGGEHDGGRGGTCHHRDRHAEPRDRPRRLQHGGIFYDYIREALSRLCVNHQQQHQPIMPSWNW